MLGYLYGKRFCSKIAWAYWLRLFSSKTFSHINIPTFSNLFILHTYLPTKMEQSVPKRRHIKFRRRGITHKKAHNNRLRLFSSKTFSHINTPTFPNLFILHTYLPTKMEEAECSETSAYKIQPSGNNPEESTQQIWIIVHL